MNNVVIKNIYSDRIGPANDTVWVHASKGAKIRNRCNQVPHLTQGTIWESDRNTRKHNMQESKETQGCKKQTWQYGKDKYKKQTKKKWPTKENLGLRSR